MNERYNIRFLIILNGPIHLSNLFKRAEKAKIDGFDLETPEIRIGNALPGTISITPGFPALRFKKILNGYDLSVFNLVYSDTKRGGFQVEVPNTDNPVSYQELYNNLNELVLKLCYNNIYAYELYINTIIDNLEYKHFNKKVKFETMKSPKYATLRIIDGDTGKKDLREEFITDIKIEKLSQPEKSQLIITHRSEKFDKDILNKLIRDITQILKIMM